ncbi:uncharacterized protein LOC113380617 [Ctenocephalides felis]|uniref:uncharacterized protein LOC113365514 n=1 Tax=Ctenocephalides felis TaxID=7515 RepID=UPI000E6E2C5D|nr:uncharacterized protein LOC113365514 [Ctenocephalides felis]XP_026475574.1 uncharacterized protein LOC113380617 [Ctenocephalides felis]
MSTPVVVPRDNVNLPHFYEQDPELWFALAESVFVHANVKDESSKFHTVVSKLDPRYASEVRNIILKPPKDNPYSALKKELLKRYGISDETKLRQLLEGQEMGDRTPSQFLRHLRSLAGSAVSKEMLNLMWSSRLPTHVQALISIRENSDIDSNAKAADRIMELETASGATTMAIASTSAHDDFYGNLASELRNMRAEISDLRKQVEDRRDGSSLRRKRRSRTPASTRSGSEERVRTLCEYHRRFGRNAMRCRSPCDMRSENSVGHRY